MKGPGGLFDEIGNLYVSNWWDGEIVKVSPNKNISTIAKFARVGHIAYYDGFIYATEIQTHKIYKIATDGSEITHIAGSGTPGREDGIGVIAKLNNPNGITISPDGKYLYVSESGSRSLRAIKLKE